MEVESTLDALTGYRGKSTPPAARARWTARIPGSVELVTRSCCNVLVGRPRCCEYSAVAAAPAGESSRSAASSGPAVPAGHPVRAARRHRLATAAAGAGVRIGQLHRLLLLLLLLLLLPKLNAAGALDWSRACVDGSHVRAEQGGADTGPSPAGPVAGPAPCSVTGATTPMPTATSRDNRGSCLSSHARDHRTELHAALVSLACSRRGAHRETATVQAMITGRRHCAGPSPSRPPWGAAGEFLVARGDSGEFERHKPAPL